MDTNNTSTLKELVIDSSKIDNTSYYYDVYKRLDEKITKLYSDLVSLTPNNFIKYYAQKNGIISEIATSLMNDFSLIDYYRNASTKSIIISQLNGFNFADFINKKSNSNHTERFKMYDKTVYQQINIMHISMLLTKYDITSLTDLHIKFYCFFDMFNYFKNIQNNTWLINVNDLIEQVNLINNCTYQSFTYLASKYGFLLNNTSEISKTEKKNSRKKNFTEKDILMMFLNYSTEKGLNVLEEELTQTQKKEAIMQYAKCGSTTARKYLKQFGMTNKKYERNDYKEIHDHIDDAVDEINDHIDGAVEKISDNITSSNEKISDNIAELKTLITNLYNVSPSTKVDLYDVQSNFKEFSGSMTIEVPAQQKEEVYEYEDIVPKKVEEKTSDTSLSDFIDSFNEEIKEEVKPTISDEEKLARMKGIYDGTITPSYAKPKFMF